ncbi:MAG: hypothetical protein SFY80_00835 [Verrucomicrobiota bacterium]|nr:hypothetical protein [Verrucomicrobiota bacterium]
MTTATKPTKGRKTLSTATDTKPNISMPARHLLTIALTDEEMHHLNVCSAIDEVTLGKFVRFAMRSAMNASYDGALMAELLKEHPLTSEFENVTSEQHTAIQGDFPEVAAIGSVIVLPPTHAALVACACATSRQNQDPVKFVLEAAKQVADSLIESYSRGEEIAKVS